MRGVVEGSADIDGACLFLREPRVHPDRPSLAVLPFSHSPGDDVIAWTAQVLGEDISIQLARMRGFLVVSRNSTERYRDREIGLGGISLKRAVRARRGPFPARVRVPAATKFRLCRGW